MYPGFNILEAVLCDEKPFYPSHVTSVISVISVISPGQSVSRLQGGGCWLTQIRLSGVCDRCAERSRSV